MATNYSVTPTSLSNTKNTYAASNDGVVQVMSGYDYIYPAQALAAGATISFAVTNTAGLKGVYFVEVEASPFVPAYSVSALGNLNSASATAAVGGVWNVLTVPGGTITVAGTATGINVTASAGVTGFPLNFLCALNKIGS